MEMYYSRVTLARKKKEKPVNALNRPASMRGKDKPKYNPPDPYDRVTGEAFTVGHDAEDAKVNPEHLLYTGWCVFRYKKLPGKKSDYEVVHVEHIRYVGKTAYDDPKKPETKEVLRDWPAYVPPVPKPPVEAKPEPPKFKFPSPKFSK